MAASAKAQTDLKNFQSVFSLDGKVAVVTGGSRGLGLHAASGFDNSLLSAAIGLEALFSLASSYSSLIK